MKYRFFHVSALTPQVGESELNAFCASHRVASVDKALIMDGTNSYWTFCVEYLDGAEKAPQTRQGRIDYKEVLDESDWRRGELSALDLQAGYAAVHSIVAHGDSGGWRREQLLRFPAPEV